MDKMGRRQLGVWLLEQSREYTHGTGRKTPRGVWRPLLLQCQPEGKTCVEREGRGSVGGYAWI